MNKTYQTKTGTVVSLHGPASCVVEVAELLSHPKYHKRYRRARRFHAHVTKGPLRLGQVVTIIESRPYSRLKRWRVLHAVT
ncbi:MAG: 30S ribosomal protein S17 [Parcubacteria group bacterium]